MLADLAKRLAVPRDLEPGGIPNFDGRPRLASDNLNFARLEHTREQELAVGRYGQPRFFAR